MKRCPHCSRDLDSSALNFCPHCGGSLTKEEALEPPPLPRLSPSEDSRTSTSASHTSAASEPSATVIESRPVIPRYTPWAVLAVFLCCLPTAVVSLAYDLTAGKRLARGDLEGAQRASKTSRLWLIISVVAGILWWILLLVSVLASEYGTDTNLNLDL